MNRAAFLILSLPGPCLDAPSPMSLLRSTFDPYRVLNVPRSADVILIRAAYRALAWRNHPDRGGDPDRMVTIKKAWQVLGDPGRRAEFDAGTFANDQSPIRAADRDDANVMRFGRYTGWTIAELAERDPDFLRWLARTPTGRQYAVEIVAALGLGGTAGSPSSYERRTRVQAS